MTANCCESTIGHHSVSTVDHFTSSHAKGTFLKAAGTQNGPFHSKTYERVLKKKMQNKYKKCMI